VISVRVERDLCIGSGNCVRLAPGVFELDGEEIAVVVDPSAARPATLVRAGSRCPAGAIFVDEADVTATASGEVSDV
jgi:ferredoxin